MSSGEPNAGIANENGHNNIGAGEGNRTPVFGLGSRYSTIELHPRIRLTVASFLARRRGSTLECRCSGAEDEGDYHQHGARGDHYAVGIGHERNPDHTHAAEQGGEVLLLL